MSNAERGHRTKAHTADLRIEAWASTRETCLAEAVAALVSSFADTAGARPERTITTQLTAASDDDRLAATLDEVIYTLDTQHAIPLAVHIEDHAEHLALRMDVTDLDRVEIIGAAPKAVALTGLRLSRDDRRWSCTATIDV